MTQRNDAAESLEVIRSLMERATVYRAISRPTAFIAGGLAMLAGSCGHMVSVPWWQLWLTVLLVVVIFNTTLVMKKAASEKKAIFSPGLKLAIRSISPPLLVGAVLGVLILGGIEQGGSGFVATVWIISYGLALMATGNFAPKSMWYLGAAFVLSGLLCAVSLGPVTDRVASILMGGTFGVFHVAYGIWMTLIEKGQS